MIDPELEALLCLDGFSYEAASGCLVEFMARRTDVTPERPHGLSYALVLRPSDGGTPWLRFDNAHAIEHRGARYRRPPAPYDHWHRTETDSGRPYRFTTAVQLLDDFWREVRRVLDEKGIPNDL